MMTSLQAQVLIVGGGPVGLTLAIDLAQRGIDVLVAETRHRGEAPSVKCNHISARSMEILRRLGVAPAMRAAGLPDDYPNDVAYRTSFTGTEISRIPIPARKDRYTATGGPDTWWPTPEPPHRVNQIYLEPVLFAHAEATPNLRILNRTRIDTFTQDENGCHATGVKLDSGEAIEIRCDYLIGCDGGRSAVRKAIGATLFGTDVVGRVQSTFIRAPKLIGLLKVAPAWATFSVNPRRCGNVYAIDGKERWLVHNYLKTGETEFDSVDRDWALRQILGVGDDFAYEIISKEDWIGRRLVADRFRDRRIFLCGDASHLWIPMAGYGMNAGIADAMNLSWTLAARLNGWAEDVILEAYEAERQPITEQVSKFAMNHAFALQKKREAVPANIEDEGAEADLVRATFGRTLYDLNVRQYCCAGLNFGYYYDQSPLIAYDGEVHPTYGMDSFTPSTVPGCRTPHLWLDDGRSLYDAMGPEYTVLRFDPSVDASALVEAARKRGVPLVVLDVASPEAAALYPHALLISRPDQHVAWRGNAAPADPLALIDRLRGALTSTAMETFE
ncbi:MULTISPECIES: FAD-dependent oxidoreductase [unclassified Variovorax]|uniref:FAD-dependent oxidoreductase n=1 Tax=unclassified Variovorax TaxID=663243 RepID=UPI00086E383C|nr:MULTISPECIES: FAD-dependent oxidoreductase [unclassified Variovorax]MBN8758490.1 FAD-dependent oxidoreductase [Variovorax sp.]ODU18875.1 MAG: monooxygenase [Variovorax sp. SCN 67-85]ODV18334.1 MAG: monooxygenase [Variovorax sp. SCN 67-20]OJZ05862.1 MAG: monooxygenase [Variovorax sp. 67-131]